MKKLPFKPLSLSGIFGPFGINEDAEGVVVVQARDPYNEAELLPCYSVVCTKAGVPYGRIGIKDEGEG